MKTWYTFKLEKLLYNIISPYSKLFLPEKKLQKESDKTILSHNLICLPEPDQNPNKGSKPFWSFLKYKKLKNNHFGLYKLIQIQWSLPSYFFARLR